MADLINTLNAQHSNIITNDNPTLPEGGMGFVGRVRNLPVNLDVTENGEYTINATEEGGFDGMSKVNVKVEIPSDGGAGWITVMADKEYASMLEAEELNMMDVKGALFSWNASTGKYHVWNADEVKVWDWDLDCSANYNPGAGSPSVPSWDAEVEFPTNEYGEVIAVCAGKGIWVSTKWDQNNSGNGFKWCPSNSPLYSFQWDCSDLNGAEVAKKMYAKNAETLAGSIFAAAKDFEGIENDGTKGHWFVPSRSEIFQAVCACADENQEAGPYEIHYTYKNAYYNAAHILALSDQIWSCSQTASFSGNAYTLSVAVRLDSPSKDVDGTCLVCLHFGESLVPTSAE